MKFAFPNDVLEEILKYLTPDDIVNILEYLEHDGLNLVCRRMSLPMIVSKDDNLTNAIEDMKKWLDTPEYCRAQRGATLGLDLYPGHYPNSKVRGALNNVNILVMYAPNASIDSLEYALRHAIVNNNFDRVNTIMRCAYSLDLEWILVSILVENGLDYGTLPEMSGLTSYSVMKKVLDTALKYNCIRLAEYILDNYKIMDASCYSVEQARLLLSYGVTLSLEMLERWIESNQCELACLVVASRPNLDVSKIRQAHLRVQLAEILDAIHMRDY